MPPPAGLLAGQESARFPRAMAATDHPLASQAARTILRSGGNAMDAAVAAAYVLGVVNPQSSGLGGGGFLLYHEAAGGQVHALEFRDRAPARAAEALRRAGRERPPFRCGLAASVPCEARGLDLAHRRFGRLSRADVIGPALRLAREGFPVGRLLAKDIARFLERARKEPCTGALQSLVTSDSGERWHRGDRVKRPGLAHTLEVLAREGPEALTRGALGRAITLAAQGTGSLMSVADLQSVKPRWVTPLRGTYRGHSIVTMGPPTSGPGLLLALRRLEERGPLGASPYSGTASLALVDALRESIRVKRELLGDPLFGDVPMEPFLGVPAPPTEDIGGETTHLCVIDEDGNAVALTTTLGGAFGSYVLVPGTGIVLGNHVANFSLEPGLPNAWGTRYGPANSLAPLKTPVSAATPAMVFDEGRLSLVLGGSGSARIFTGVVQVLTRVIDHGWTAARAVVSPRLHVRGWDRTITLEASYPRPSAAVLRRLSGSPIEYGLQRSSITAIQVLDGQLLGVSDPRKYGQPRGY